MCIAGQLMFALGLCVCTSACFESRLVLTLHVSPPATVRRAARLKKVTGRQTTEDMQLQQAYALLCAPHPHMNIVHTHIGQAVAPPPKTLHVAILPGNSVLHCRPACSTYGGAHQLSVPCCDVLCCALSVSFAPPPAHAPLITIAAINVLCVHHHHHTRCAVDVCRCL